MSTAQPPATRWHGSDGSDSRPFAQVPRSSGYRQLVVRIVVNLKHFDHEKPPRNSGTEIQAGRAVAPQFLWPSKMADEHHLPCKRCPPKGPQEFTSSSSMQMCLANTKKGVDFFFPIGTLSGLAVPEDPTHCESLCWQIWGSLISRESFGGFGLSRLFVGPPIGAIFGVALWGYHHETSSGPVWQKRAAPSHAFAFARSPRLRRWRRCAMPWTRRGPGRAGDLARAAEFLDFKLLEKIIFAVNSLVYFCHSTQEMSRCRFNKPRCCQCNLWMGPRNPFAAL